jgi:acetolactate synthase-1/2/3 large subunit
MAEGNRTQTGAGLLVRRLHDYGVRHVFGYPGGPLTPLYDALYQERGIRHLLPRDEQAGAFMADGYARVTGQPGVCLAVCGPGVYNAATALATAHSDSQPVLQISGQMPVSKHGVRSGYYHENEQLAACAHFTKAQFAAHDVRVLEERLDLSWLRLTEGRPGPVLLEVPGAVLSAEVPDQPLPAPPTTLAPPAPRSSEVSALAALVSGWRRPLLLAGGGVLAAGAEGELLRLASRLGAPVLHTLMGKTAFPSDHPLAAGLTWKRATSDATGMADFMSPLLAEADGLLAIGCRFTQVTTGTWELRPPAALAQIDIDQAEIGRHYPVTCGVRGDARRTLEALLAALPPEPRRPWTSVPRPEPLRLAGMDFVGALRRALPRETIVAADVTRLAYQMLVGFPVYAPRTFLHPAAAVAMGYALPAALGAKAARPERPVVAVMGDGGFQMTGMELATAVQEKLPVIVVVVNDGALTLIKALQQRRYGGRFLGVDLRNPDFGLFARAFGVRHWAVDSDGGLEVALREAVDVGEPSLVEVRLQEGHRAG